ncbi:MAG: twin-arginine translocase subunit TatC [Candidatus Delongbacteria bacterium]|nr:twin-arginine translocase subunit TatC [bacterium]MBL7033040.1 twin-arginine translocase subunit TatC [Candidatus Delongbacteria bacterium]
MPDSDNGQELSFWGHVDELRRMLWHSIVALIVATIGTFFFARIFIAFLLIPFEKAGQGELVYLAPMEGFVTQLKVAFLAGLIISMPYLLFEAWKFIAPGLYKKERRMVFLALALTTVSFYLGAYFGYRVLPFATSFFLSFGGGMINSTWSFAHYLDYVIRIILAFGLVFELPLVIALLAILGLVGPGGLRKFRRHAYVVVFVVASIITPPDVITQVVLAVPLILLYELSIGIAVLITRRREAREAGAH